jgi:hypothetical protein
MSTIVASRLPIAENEIHMVRGMVVLLALASSACVDAFDADPAVPTDDPAFRDAEVEYLLASSPTGVTTRPLQAGVTYRVVVDGTVSLWKAADWSTICAGRPYSRPRYESPGASGPVGLDAEWAWSWTTYSDSLCPNGEPAVAPPAQRRLILMVAAADATPQPLPPPQERGMSPRHEYTYAIVGTGAPLVFRVDDAPLEDNYGALRIRIVAR